MLGRERCWERGTGVKERGFGVLDGDGGNAVVLRSWVLEGVRERQGAGGTPWRRGAGFRVPEGMVMPKGDPGAMRRPHGVEVWGFGVPEGTVASRGDAVAMRRGALGHLREWRC